MNVNMKKNAKWGNNAMLLITSIVVAICISEVALRLFSPKELILLNEERALIYQYDELLGWFPRSSSIGIFNGSRSISVAHNSRGFRDKEHVLSDKPRMVFIGDSFVWGYDVEEAERFTEKLQVKLPGWDIYNLGVSGYSTDQEFLLLDQQFDYYRPNLVFLVFCTDNDDHDNTTNAISNGGYYKPYYEVDEQRLTLEGVPVPRSLNYFARQHPALASSYVVRLLVRAASPKIVSKDYPPTSLIFRDMNKFLRQRGSQLVVGLLDPEPSLEVFMKNNRIPFVILTGAERYTTMGDHWTAAGHATVSNKIYAYLLNAGLLNPVKK